MRFLFAGAMAAVAVMAAAPQVSQAAVFAAHLNMEDNGDGTYSLSYRLNEDANQGVTINIKDSTDTIVRSISFPNQAKGPHTVQWDGNNDSSVAVPDGTYTWEVVASTNVAGSEAYVKVVDGTEREHTFYAPYGMDINTNPTSPHFGEIYVANATFGAAVGEVEANGRPTTPGIYVLGNDLTDIYNQGDTAYHGNAGFNTPYEVHVAENSEVFIADVADSNSNVFVMDPENMTGDFSRLFDDTGRSETGLNAINGSIHGLYVDGDGPDRKLYTLDRDLGGSSGNAWEYAIGETTSGFTGTPTLLFENSAHGSPFVQFGGEIHKDTNPDRTGWFLTQYRWAENATNPNVFHFDGTTIDWKSAVDFDFWLDQNAFAGIDLNEDSTRMVAAGYSYVEVIDISDLDAMDDDSVLYGDVGVGDAGHRDIRFDAVENFAVVANVTEQLLFYSKTGENTYTTPNPTGAEIVIGASSVDGWELY